MQIFFPEKKGGTECIHFFLSPVVKIIILKAINSYTFLNHTLWMTEGKDMQVLVKSCLSDVAQSPSRDDFYSKGWNKKQVMLKG